MLLLANLAEVFKTGTLESIVTVVGSIGAIGAPIGGVVWWIASRFYRSKIQACAQQNKKLHDQLDAANATAKTSRQVAAHAQRESERKSAALEAALKELA